MFYGVRVQVAPDHPKYELPDDLPLPAKFREEFKSWSLQYCGYYNPVRDGEVLRYSPSATGLPGTASMKDVMLVNPRTYAKLMQELNHAEANRTD